MLATFTFLLLSNLAPEPQDVAGQQGIQRELRIHTLGALAAPRELKQLKLTQGRSAEEQEMENRVRNHLDNVARGADAGAARDSDTRVRLKFNFESNRALDPAVIRDYAALATRFCEPAIDPAEERIQPEDQGFLIAYLQPAQHEWLEKFLALQRAPAINWIAEATVQLYSVPAGALGKMKLEGSATLLVDKQSILSMGATLVAQGAELVVAPKLSFFPNQRSDLSVLDEVAYVRSYELRVIEPGSVEIADPIVDVIKEGQVVRLRAIQVAEALYGLEIESVISEIERPIPTKKMRLSPVHPTEVEIGMPQVRTATVNATVRLANDSGVLLIASGLAKDRDLALVLTFHRSDTRVVDYELGDF